MAYGDETPPLIERSHLYYLSFRMDDIADLYENDKTHLVKLIQGDSWPGNRMIANPEHKVSAYDEIDRL
jgi:hypothetical protein